MKFFAKTDTNSFVIHLFTPHDEFIPADAVEITGDAYAKTKSSGEVISDYKVVGTDLVVDSVKQKLSLIKEQHLLVKQEAEKKILLVSSDIKRNSLMAASMVLLNDNRNGRLLSTDEENFLSANVVLQKRVEAIREASNLIEAEITNHTEPLSYNIKVSPLWPE